MTTSDPEDRANRQRARTVHRLFLRIALHILWWDVILNRGLLRQFRSPAPPRWARLAEDYRYHAERLGGVLIKLGQYASARVDLLPEQVTSVLEKLHDAVPPAPSVLVIEQIEADFGRPITSIFRSFDPIPVGAASLGQAHRARLLSGERVIVKVLRPGITGAVSADIRIIGTFVRRLRRVKAVRRRVDLSLLMSEFTTVTLRELDCHREGQNAERFARDFAHDPQIYVPKIHWAQSNSRMLTMEDVSFFPINNVAAYEAAGISRRRVARKLMDCYLDQVFRTGFIHADPHPGNLFVRPLPEPSEVIGDPAAPRSFGPGDPVPFAPGRPFQIVFIDFGMAVAIPEHARRSLRSYAIGIGTRDAYTIVQSYIEGDLLLPDADIVELERMTEALLRNAPHAFVGQMRESDMATYEQMFSEYQNLIYNSPMKIRADLLFVFRAIGVCAGTTARVDPHFDPADSFLPLAQRLMADDWNSDPDRLRKIAFTLLRLPARLDNLLTQLERGKLRIRTSDADEAVRRSRAIIQSLSELKGVLLGSSLIIAAAVLASESELATAQVAGGILAAAAVVIGLTFRRRS